MTKEQVESTKQALRIGKIRGKSFVIEHYLKRALELFDFDQKESFEYTKDALKEIKELRKIALKI